MAEYPSANPLIEAIKVRRSIRSYQDRPIPQETVKIILDAACFAPSALNKQPWSFIVVTNRALIAELSLAIKRAMEKLRFFLPIAGIFRKEMRDEKVKAAFKKTAAVGDDTVFYQAPLVVFIVSDKPGNFSRLDCAISAQNMMLAAHSLGLGSCFIGRGELLMRQKKILRKIGVPPGYRIHATVVFGYAKDQPPCPQRKEDTVLNWYE